MTDFNIPENSENPNTDPVETDDIKSEPADPEEVPGNYNYIQDKDARQALIEADKNPGHGERYTYENLTDEDGNPAGGSATGTGISIEWQNGPRGRNEDGELNEPNGAFVEDVIEIAVKRIQFYQASRFATEENAQAIIHLNRALKYLRDRIARRQSEGTLGTLNGR